MCIVYALIHGLMLGVLQYATGSSQPALLARKALQRDLPEHRPKRPAGKQGICCMTLLLGWLRHAQAEACTRSSQLIVACAGLGITSAG